MLVRSVFRNLSNISYGVFCEKLLTVVAILTILILDRILKTLKQGAGQAQWTPSEHTNQGLYAF